MRKLQNVDGDWGLCTLIPESLEIIEEFPESKTSLDLSSSTTREICTSNHMFKREIWDKSSEFTFLKFWNLPSETREISKFQKMNEVSFPRIPLINM